MKTTPTMHLLWAAVSGLATETTLIPLTPVLHSTSPLTLVKRTETYCPNDKEYDGGCIPYSGRCCNDGDGGYCAIDNICWGDGCCPIGKTCEGSIWGDDPTPDDDSTDGTDGTPRSTVGEYSSSFGSPSSDCTPEPSTNYESSTSQPDSLPSSSDNAAPTPEAGTGSPPQDTEADNTIPPTTTAPAAGGSTTLGAGGSAETTATTAMPEDPEFVPASAGAVVVPHRVVAGVVAIVMGLL